MPSIGPRCHELRIPDHEQGQTWRIIYRLDADAIVVVDAFSKKTRRTPTTAIRRASHRLRHYDEGPEGGFR
jgi:phage-related protein